MAAKIPSVDTVLHDNRVVYASIGLDVRGHYGHLTLTIQPKKTGYRNWCGVIEVSSQIGSDPACSIKDSFLDNDAKSAFYAIRHRVRFNDSDSGTAEDCQNMAKLMRKIDKALQNGSAIPDRKFALYAQTVLVAIGAKYLLSAHKPTTKDSTLNTVSNVGEESLVVLVEYEKYMLAQFNPTR